MTVRGRCLIVASGEVYRLLVCTVGYAPRESWTPSIEAKVTHSAFAYLYYTLTLL